jgi:L-fucose isomerase-like protein
LADAEFTLDRVVISPAEVESIREELKKADGILVIHMAMGISSILQQILAVGVPTMVFAIPYSGHEWCGWGQLISQPHGPHMDCILTSDRKQLAAAIRPIRAIHHLREAKILDVTERLPVDFAKQMKEKFGTEIKQVGLKEVEAAYNAVDEAQARAETDRWIQGAAAVVEPSAENVYKSCRQALAFEKMLADEQATVMTVDCYGSMWNKTIRLPAYPCLGLSRLNSLGLGGICESDLQCAMTHILFQGLAGKPGFISDPTMDESNGSIILAHCMAPLKVLGPQQPAFPYKLRTVHERQEGVTPQVKMPIGPKVTQAKLINPDLVQYFTGQVIDVPECDRGCRNKLTVRIDGDPEKLWRNWSSGLHRVTCYGDIHQDLARFCRLMQMKLGNEAVGTELEPR